MRKSSDKFAPRGYRFLVQRVDDCTEEEALSWARRTFRKEGLVTVRGHTGGCSGGLEGNKTIRPSREVGWMIFCKK